MIDVEIKEWANHSSEVGWRWFYDIVPNKERKLEGKSAFTIKPYLPATS